MIRAHNTSFGKMQTREIQKRKARTQSKKKKGTQPSAKKMRKEENTSSSSRMVIVGNLSSDVEELDLKHFFKKAGDVDYIRFIPSQKCLVVFCKQEAVQIALTLNGEMLKGLPVDLHCRMYDKKRVFVAGFDNSLTERKLRDSLKKTLAFLGKIKSVCLPDDKGGIEGKATITFNSDGYKNALNLNGTPYFTVEEALAKRRVAENGTMDPILGDVSGSGGEVVGEGVPNSIWTGKKILFDDD